MNNRNNDTIQGRRIRYKGSRGGGVVQEEIHKNMNEELPFHAQNIYLGSKIIKGAYKECRLHQLSTCRFLRMDEKLSRVLLDDCKKYFHGISGNILVDLTTEDIGKMNQWSGFVKNLISKIELFDHSLQRKVCGMDAVLTHLYQRNPNSLESLRLFKKGSSSLKNAIFHFLQCEESEVQKKQILRNFVNGEKISMSELREFGISDVKTCMNRRNGIHFLKSYIDCLISLGGETLILLVRMKGAPKEDSNAPTKQEIDTQEMVKDLIDRTVLSYLKNTLLLLMVDREWNPHLIQNEALKSRLYLDENSQGDFPHIMSTVYPVPHYRKR
jgi:hypothetical protein